MTFEEVYGRTHRGMLSQGEAAEVPGVSERTFRRWRRRFLEQLEHRLDHHRPAC